MTTEDNKPTSKLKFFKKKNKKNKISKEPGRMSQFVTVFKMTQKYDSTLILRMFFGFLITIAIGMVAGLLFINMLTAIIIAIPAALFVAMFILSRRAQSAAYAQIEGQAGAALAALKSLKRGWVIAETPIAMDPKTQEVLFRIIGRSGIIVVSEGNHNKVRRMFEVEKKKINRIVPNVPIFLVETGSEENQVKLAKLVKTIKKFKSVLNKNEVHAISKRLNAIGTGLPIPKGVDPRKIRPDRKATKGK